MNSIITAFHLARVDARWRFLKILYISLPVCGVVMMLPITRLNGPKSAQAGMFGVFFVVLCFSHLIGVQRIGFPYQLGLPIPRRTLFLTTLLLTGFAICVPAFIVATLFAIWGHFRAVSPVVFVSLWMCGACVLWLGWPQRQSAPGAARATIWVVQTAALLWASGHPPSLLTASFLLAVTMSASFIVYVRTRSLTFADARRISSPRSISGNAWVTLARITLQPMTVATIIVALIAPPKWPMQAFWIFILYNALRPGSFLLLNLPLSRLSVMYLRLLCAFLLAAVLAPYSDPMGRLMRSHSDPNMVTAVIALALGLLLIAAAKLTWWRRLRHWPKRPLLAMPLVLIAAFFPLSFLSFTDRVAKMPAVTIVPVALVFIILLLTVITLETRESDLFGIASNPSPGLEVLNRA